nr:MAG TPA: Restriction endonuclease [Caudoviricetes sp.]
MIKLAILSFEEYKRQKLKPEFETSVNKVNPYNGKVIRTVDDLIEYKREYNFELYTADKTIINPYTKENFATFDEYQQFLDLPLRWEYDEYLKNVSPPERSNFYFLKKTGNTLILIVKIGCSGILLFWWILYIISAVITYFLNLSNVNLHNQEIGLLITILIYFFFIISTALIIEKDDKVSNLKSELSNLEKKLNNTATFYEMKYEDKLQSLEDEYREKNSELETNFRHKNDDLVKSYSQTKLALDKREEEINSRKVYIENIVNETSQKYPWLATIYSELFYSVDKKIAADLKNKKRPALKASDSVMEIAQEKRQLMKENKMLEYQLHYLETLFPWLEDFEEADPYKAHDYIYATENNLEHTEYDKLKSWLSPEEYAKLSTTEKYQLALDRYQKRKKSDWDIGIEYERYVGYLYESKGYKVKYNGALMGLEDMGRDLLVEKGDETLVIQCKRWAKSKTIHEKHIFQLYGSLIVASIKDPKRTYKGIFITSTTLSSLAKKCADSLKIKVKENFDFDSYPLIKCNLSKTGEKIYHLPFDQQYDRVDISPSKGEFYAYTIEEAEAKGFRRAFRWTADK